MSFILTNRAYRFTVGSKHYAVDIFNDGIVYDKGAAVHLFHEVGDGWNRAHTEMEPVLYIDQAAIDAAGGIVPLCQIIVAKLNKALRILTGATGEGEIPAGTLPHEVVMDYLRTHLDLTVVGGVPTLRLGE